MEITQDFIQSYIDKAQNEIAELNKTKVYQSAQVEYLDRELQKLRDEVLKMKEEYEMNIAALEVQLRDALADTTANNILQNFASTQIPVSVPISMDDSPERWVEAPDPKPKE
jgi:chromosome segregation ATPase